MLASLFGSVNKERVLVYLAARGRGYAREIARFFDAPLYPVQYAMDKLELAGVLGRRTVGSTREYEFNPRYPPREELVTLINRGLALYPKPLQNRLLLVRTRPRRRGKPLVQPRRNLKEIIDQIHPARYRRRMHEWSGNAPVGGEAW